MKTRKVILELRDRAVTMVLGKRIEHRCELCLAVSSGGKSCRPANWLKQNISAPSPEIPVFQGATHTQSQRREDGLDLA